MEASDPQDDAEVLRVVLREHDELRAHLDEIDARLLEVAAGSGRAFVDVRGRFQLLLVRFLLHLDREEALLVPILEHLEAWGPVRLEQMHREHAEQRRRVAELSSLDAETSAAHWAMLMRDFSSALREDMAGEEHDFVGPNAVQARPG